jgi:hypothetical protein
MDTVFLSAGAGLKYYFLNSAKDAYVPYALGSYSYASQQSQMTITDPVLGTYTSTSTVNGTSYDYGVGVSFFSTEDASIDLTIKGYNRSMGGASIDGTVALLGATFRN